jgi:hypothetical protein
MDKKRAKIKLKEYLRKLDENTKDLPMSKEGSPIVTKKFSSGELADLIGPSKPKGSVSPKIRAYDDEFQSAYGAGVNVTTKKGVSFDFDVDKTNTKEQITKNLNLIKHLLVKKETNFLTEFQELKKVNLHQLKQELLLNIKMVVCAEVWAKPLEVGNLRGSSNDSLGSIRFRI